MTHRRATLALLFVVFLWGFSFSAIKAVLRDMSPLFAVGLRFGVASLVLVPLLRGLTRRELVAGLVIGGLFATGVAFQNVGLEITTPSRSAFIVSLSALLTPAVGGLVLRHRTRTQVVVRIGIAMAGVFLLTAPDGSLASINRGDWMTLVAALVFAGHIVSVGYFAVGSNIARLLAIKFAVTSLVGWSAMAVLETARIHPTPLLFGLLGFLTLSSLITFSLQLRAQRVLTASEAALIFTFEPVMAAAVSYLAFGERLSGVQLVGGLAILVAVGWPQRRAAGGEVAAQAGVG